eukprot:TRINITY_DN7194_c0_g1_i1.p1 TRINITY_DN7194_c0_g1~~TRINITY_DN7194_c0_g1_i1.p1  ORF type:complete len:935 (-),score=286.74 TRINITY_DN7194_c0_g1_i1:10-2781(-)
MLQYGTESEETAHKDLKEEKGFAAFFHSIPIEHEGSVIRLFHRSNQQIYGIHGKEARFLASEYFKSVKVLKRWGSSSSSKPAAKKLKSSQGDAKPDELEYVTVREKSELEDLLKFLIFDKQLQVEIWEQKREKWDVELRASPGNYERIEHLLSSTDQIRETPPIMAAWLSSTAKGAENLGVAIVNTTLRVIKIAEFEDNEQLNNFETIVVQSGVRECLFGSMGKPTTKLESVLLRCNVPQHKKKSSDFKSDNVIQDLNRLLGENANQDLDKFELKLAMKSTACLINFLELLSDESNFGNYRIEDFQFSTFVRLDSAAVEALNLFPDRGEVGKKSTNLFGLLNHCGTAMGMRKLSQWIRQPLKDREAILSRQDVVSVFVDDAGLRDNLRLNYLKRDVPDVDKLSKRVLNKKASLEDAVKLYYMFKKLPECVEMIRKYVKGSAGNIQRRERIAKLFLKPMEENVEMSQKLIEMIEQVVDLERAEQNEFIIKPDFDEELQKLETVKRTQREKMWKHHEFLCDKFQLKESMLSLEYKKKLGWYLEMTTVNAKKCGLNDKKGIIKVDNVRKTGVRFQDETLKSFSEKYIEAAKLYEQKQAELLKDIQEVLISYVEVLEKISSVISDLDVFVSFAHVASQNQYVKPQILEAGQEITLVKARHPCLDVQDDVRFVPNDIEMKKETSRFIIITGPNMGGKSTYIRQVGMLTLMSQIGSYVPCESASVSVVDCILARVGANDSQLRGVSTFMAEMLEMSNILKTATENSLVIIDELGRGTSTYDGFGLAKAISETLCERGCFCLFATHFHELTEMDRHVDYVKNLHVKADIIEGELILQHEVMPGASLQSYGIHVAELANFPKSVIETAKRKAAELEKFESTDIHEEVMEKFMDEFKKIPLDTLSQDEALKRIEELKATLKLEEHLAHHPLN